MNGEDFYEYIASNKRQIARNYLQFDYLRKFYESEFEMVSEALERLPSEGPITSDLDRYALEAIEIIIENMPENDSRTWEMIKRYSAVRRRLADPSQD